MSTHTKKPVIWFTELPAPNNIIHMLLNLKNAELAMPIADPTSHQDHGLRHELGTDITVNLVVDDKKDPPTLRHMQRSKYWNEWLTAMHEELEALKAKDVYKEVAELPRGRKAIQCKWVLHIKCNKNGQISHFKGYERGCTLMRWMIGNS